MDNLGLLLFQIADSLDNRRHQAYSLRQGETFFRLLLPQLLQIRPLNIIHKHIETARSVIFKHTINTRQRKMIEPTENLTLKNEALALASCGLYHFFESKDIAPGALILHTIYSTETALAKHILDKIATLDQLPPGKSGLYISHPSPQ